MLTHLVVLWQRWRSLDPRLLQMAFLLSFVAVGIAGGAIPASEPLLTVSAACLTQAWGDRVRGVVRPTLRSAAITGLGTAALLRSDLVWVAPLAAAAGIAAKFWLRTGERHLFNPANLAVGGAMLLTDHAWVSPSQWGESAVLLAWVVLLGVAVTTRAFRADVSLAFLGAIATLKLCRVLYLGQRSAVLWHQITLGSLLIFTFFMISDPKTTPASRPGRLALGAAVALAAFVLQTRWIQNGPIWSLLVLGPTFALAEKLANRFTPPTGWLSGRRAPAFAAVAGVLALFAPATSARAFCGFYVAKADASLFNRASQVVLVRQDNHTVLTMANDYQGDLTEFAVVVPVPTVLTKEQIHIGDPQVIARLDGWSGPRLVEYTDPNPCAPRDVMKKECYTCGGTAMLAAPAAAPRASAASLGVKIEAEYTVGEYDIVILSAKQSDGLQTYLLQEGYKIPAKAASALAPYLQQGMKFFVAKVNLKAQSNLGFKALRPIQIAYDSEKFMLPLRLGMANAGPGAPQDLVVYAITPKGRVESVNYRTVKLPTDEKVPLFVKDDFPNVYKAIFEKAWEKEDRRAVLTEYAWSSSWCDPCADTPLSAQELRSLGVFFLPGNAAGLMPRGPFGGQPFITRLHVRYDAEHFPEDLMFQETGDQNNYQARYVLNHPAQGDLSCPAAKAYLSSVNDRRELEAATLASLTGWPRAQVVSRMGDQAPGQPVEEPWYRKVWK